jgi:hypothetical protein
MSFQNNRLLIENHSIDCQSRCFWNKKEKTGLFLGDYSQKTEVLQSKSQLKGLKSQKAIPKTGNGLFEGKRLAE